MKSRMTVLIAASTPGMAITFCDENATVLSQIRFFLVTWMMQTSGIDASM